MNLGDRNAQRHQVIRKEAVDSTLWWDFKPGQRVQTVEGFPGIVTAVSDGPVPGAEEYEVVLDAGLGGGSYAPGELRALDPPLAAEAARFTPSEQKALDYLYAKGGSGVFIDQIVADLGLDGAGLHELQGALVRLWERGYIVGTGVDQLGNGTWYAAYESLDDAQQRLGAASGPIRQERKNRQTGTTILVGDTHHPDSEFPDDGGRWVTVCVDHGGSVNHISLEDAKSWASDPKTWCEGCQRGDPSIVEGAKQADVHTAQDDYPELGDILERRPNHEHAIPVTASLQTTAGEKGKTTLWSVDKASYEASSYEGEYRGTMVRFERITDDTDRDRFGNRLSSPVTQWYGYIASGMDGLKPRWSVVAESEPTRKAAIETVERHIDRQLRSEGRKHIASFDSDGQQIEAGFLTDHVIGPVVDRVYENLPPQFQTADTTYVPSYDWCRFRRASHCWYSHKIDEALSQQLGRVIWIPEDRGVCPRISWDAQKSCPISEPGPHSKDPNAKVDATLPYDAGGQRFSSLHNVAALIAEAEAQADPEWRFHFVASWSDVRAKAKRIRAEGGVRIIAAPTETDTTVSAEVRGDHNIYETTILREPGKRSVASWACGCAWSSYSWGRSGRWKRYEGRMCSHALALTFEVQARGMFGRTINEDRMMPPWRLDPTIPVVQPENYPKPKKRRASLEVEGAVEVPEGHVLVRCNSHRARESLERLILGHPPIQFVSFTADPVYAIPQEAWEGAQALGGSALKGLKLAPKNTDLSQYRKPLDTGASMRPVETSKDLAMAPAVLMAHAALSEGADPNEVMAYLVELGCADAPGIMAQALQTRDIPVKVRGIVRRLLNIVNGEAHLDGGEVVPLGAVTYPTYDKTLGLDLRDNIPHLAGNLDDLGPARLGEFRHELVGLGTDGGSLIREGQGADQSGVMICFKVPDKLAKTLAELGTEKPEDIHLTLAYFGKPDEVDGDALHEAVRSFADKAPSLMAEVSGLGTFENGPENVLIATWDIPGIDRFRSDLVQHLAGFDVEPYNNHGFTPHATLAYGDEPFRKLPALPDEAKGRFAITGLWLTIGSEWARYPLQPLGARTAATYKGAGGWPEPTNAKDVQTFWSLPHESRQRVAERSVVLYGSTTVARAWKQALAEELEGNEHEAGREGQHVLDPEGHRYPYDEPWFDPSRWTPEGYRSLKPGEASRIHFRVNAEATEDTEEAADMAQAMVRTNGGEDVAIEQESLSGDVTISTSNDMSAWWTMDGAERMTNIRGIDPNSFRFEAAVDDDARNNPPSLDWCKECGTRIRKLGPKWRHMNPQRSGDPWEHPAQPGGKKNPDPGAHRFGELHDEPEPALPETDGAEEEDGDAPQPGDPRLGWLVSGEAQTQNENAEIAAAARETLAKLSGKVFTPAEQRQIIDEGQDVTAANLTDLDLSGTHYEQLEAALTEEEEDESWLVS